MNKNSYYTFALLLISSILFSNCSSDELDTDVIIGKWIVTSKYDEIGNQIELHVCDEIRIYEFNGDFSMGSSIDMNDLPQGIGCEIFPIHLYKWEKLGTDNYQIIYMDDIVNPTISFFIEDGKLASIRSETNNKSIYSRQN